MTEVIKDYTKSEIQKGIERDMINALRRRKVDLRQQAYNRRIKVQNNILSIHKNLVNHGKINQETEKKYQQLQSRFTRLRDIELPKIANKEFAYVQTLATKKPAIEQFAIKLDTYEDEVLNLLRPLVQLQNEENQFFNEDESNFDDICGPYLKLYLKGQDQNDKSLVLNSATNPIPIHSVLKESSLNQGKVRKIDYSGCTNNRIKEKMINCLGGKENCYIYYSPNTKTYNLFDREGKLLSQRALIREGVKLYPPYLLNREGSQRAKEKAEKTALDRMRNLSSDKENELLGRIPEKLKNILSEAQQKEFIKYSENILNSTIISARKNGEQLSGEPIKLTNFGGIKLCTLTEHNRYHRDLHPNGYYTISKELNDILNKNERHVRTYLNSRVLEKRNDASSFSNRDIINIKPIEDDDVLKDEERDSLVNGINALIGMLGNYKLGVARDTFDLLEFSSIKDRPVADLESYLNNLIYTIELGNTNRSLLKQAEIEISNKLRVCGFKFDSSANSGMTIEDFVRIMLESGEDERQIALRNLGTTSNWVRHDTSLSSDQLRYAVMNKENIRIKNEEYNECLQKIETYFLVGDNDEVEGDNKCAAAKNIDDLYKCSSGESVFNFFKTKGLVPATCDYSDFDDICDNIYKKIDADNKQIKETETEMRENSKGRLDRKYNEILAKDEKDENDISFLNKYEFLSSPEGKPYLDKMVDEIIPSVINTIKYLNPVSFLKGTLGVQLARLGGGLDESGLSGTDLNIVKDFNDSIGSGGVFDFKDESVELTHEIIKEVIKEVIICAIIAVMTEGVGVGPRLAAKLPKWGLRIANRVMKGIAFHIASTLIHNAIDVINGDKTIDEMATGLDDRKGYACSIIFFAVMEIIPIGAGKALTKIKGDKVLKTLTNLEKAGKLPQGKTAEMVANELKLNIRGTMDLLTSDMGFLCKSLSNLGVDAGLFTMELTSMLLAEQIGSLLTEGGFHNPSPEEIAQTIGMILAFKGIGKIKGIIKGRKGEKIFQLERTGSNNGGKGSEKTINISEKEMNKLLDEFDSKIMSEQGVTIDGITYKLERSPPETHGQNRKGRIKYTEIGPNGEPIFTSTVESNSFVLPENGKGNGIRERFNNARQKYINNNIEAFVARTRQETQRELSRNLEESRRNKEALEGQRKELRDEIELLSSRIKELEQQLQNIPKEITEQPQTVSLKDIENVFFRGAGKTVSIGGIKCEFIGVKDGKIYFTNFEKPFSSFKELKDAGIKFDIDIKVRAERGRVEKTYEKQQRIFDELVRAEGIVTHANNIIREYKQLQNQKKQIENNIRHNQYFADHAQELVGRHIRIDGVEYQCTSKKTNNGRTTLEFKQTDGNNRFSVSSFKQLNDMGQINGFGDRNTVQNKETRAAGRELSEYERTNHELLHGKENPVTHEREPGLFKGEEEYLEQQQHDLQEINELLEVGQDDYNNAVSLTSSREVANPEYERIQAEINGIKEQIDGRRQDLLNVETELGTSETEIAAIEREINELTSQGDEVPGDNNVSEQGNHERPEQDPEAQRLEQEQEAQRLEQERLEQERVSNQQHENVETFNGGERNVETPQEKLDIMCGGDVTVENCGLTEGQINQVYSIFGKIKEITGMTKLTKLELQIIKYDKIGLKDLEHVQNMRNKILEIIDSNTIDLSDIGVFKEISEQQLDYFISLKGKINQLIGKINSTDLYNLNKISKGDLANLLDNIIINKGKIDKLTGNKTLDGSDIHELSEIENLSENLDIIIANKEKIEQFTGIRRNKFGIMDIKELAGITERGINNALNIRSKISILTEKDTFSLEDINNLTDIDENTLNRLILLKEKYGYGKVLNIKSFKLLKNLSENEFKKIQEITEGDPRNIIDMYSLEGYKKLEIINNKIFKLTKEKGVDYAIVNKYGSIRLEYVGDKTYIFHAGMRDRTGTVNIQQIAGKAFFEFANLIPDGYKITETHSLSGDSFPLFLREYQRDFRTDYTVRATGKFIYLNSQGEYTPESKIISSKNVGKSAIFEAATQTDAQEVANAINNLIKDHGQPLGEGQGIVELPEARVVQSKETGLRRVEIPQIEMVKEFNNGVELAQQLNKCTTYNELENILLENLATEYHFRDGNLTGQEILDRCRLYRKGTLVGPDEDPRRYFPSEFTNPAKWVSLQGIPTWWTTTRKTNIHKLLDS